MAQFHRKPIGVCENAVANLEVFIYEGRKMRIEGQIKQKFAKLFQMKFII